jgi:hypothetical protein
MVLNVRHLRRNSRPLDQDFGPDAPVQCLGAVREDSHRCSRSLPTEQPRKSMRPDPYGIFYIVAGSLRHSESKGFDGGRSAGHQLLLLRHTSGVT